MSELSVNEILNQLKKTEQLTSIYVPTQQKDIDFKPITLLQQKGIMDKVTVNSFGIVEFFNTIYELINTLTVTDIKGITVIDRINIVLSFRSSINKTYEGVDLPTLLIKNRSIVLPVLNKTVKSDKFVFDISVPSITADYTSNLYLINNFKDEKQLLGKMMVNELSKFINKLTILNDTDTVIDFNTQSLKNKFTIIESIESKHFNEIFEYITQIRDIEQEFVKFEDKQIDIGPELFIL